MIKNHLSHMLAALLHANVAESTSLVQNIEILAHECIQDTFRRLSETIGNFGDVALEFRGDALVANYALEGSARKAANRIRVTAQLVDGKSANHLWAEHYDRDFDDVIDVQDVQDELTRRIVETISTRIEFDSLERTKRKSPTNMVGL